MSEEEEHSLEHDSDEEEELSSERKDGVTL